MIGTTLSVRSGVFVTMLAWFASVGAAEKSKVFGSEQSFQAYVTRFNLVGLPSSEATLTLSRNGFNCDNYDRLPLTAPVVCGKYIVGWTLAEELTVALYRSADGSTILRVTPGYLPITGP
jgi:hypothetical protein